MAAAATTTVEVSDDGDHPVLRDDERGIPRSLTLLAAIVEADAARHAAAATRPAESDLVRAFRGGATPTVAIGEFLERIHAFVRLESVRHDIREIGHSAIPNGGIRWNAIPQNGFAK
ncbi:hypothetical protein OsI_25439 [Oryza sativa Indica Group]|uniref:Uncharacterized protein n=1 Tax=Oryza sativa subsp. indica TaxID=39946 RepID=A2YJN4_ORYSI|nr:hypothetical protein OsI_25439 [Oryza sativa Indica Group]